MSWTVPSGHIFATSEVVTASTMNTYIQANLTFLGIGYGASMYQVTTQSIPSATETVVHFDTIDFDPNGMCTTGVSAQITIPANAGGVYVITWRGGINNTWAGEVLTWLRRNGSDVAQVTTPVSAGSVPVASGTAIRLLSPADTLQMTIQHNEGVAQNTLITNQANPTLSCHLLGPN